MIALDEMKSTIQRLTVLQNNVDDAEEAFMANVLVKNLNTMMMQMEMVSTTPQFKNEAAAWFKAETSKESADTDSTQH